MPGCNLYGLIEYFIRIIIIILYSLEVCHSPLRGVFLRGAPEFINSPEDLVFLV